MKKIIALFGTLLMAVGILAACGETEVEEVDGGTTSKETKDEKVEDKVYKVGDTVKVNGLEITLTSAQYTDPEQYSEATQGKVLTIEVQTSNKNDEQMFIDNTEFSLYDTDGNKLEDYFGYNDLAISGNVSAGKKMAGKLYFDVPESEKFELIYTPSFSFDNKEIKFEIVPK